MVGASINYYNFNLWGNNAMKYKEVWEIPKSDKVERCASCLKSLFRKMKFPSPEHKNERFPNVCYGCKIKNNVLI